MISLDDHIIVGGGVTVGTGPSDWSDDPSCGISQHFKDRSLKCFKQVLLSKSKSSKTVFTRLLALSIELQLNNESLWP